MIILKRHTEDLMDCTEEELTELGNLSRTLRNAIRQSFAPSLLNYASLGNIVRHTHVHIIPRYEQAVVFNGKTFTDPQWGKAYTPYDTEDRSSDAMLGAITSEIRTRFIPPSHGT